MLYHKGKDMEKLDQEKIDEIKEIFDYFDSDNNGVIDYNEFTKLIDALEGDMSDEEMQVGFDIIDDDHNRNIDFDEFIEWWGER